MWTALIHVTDKNISWNIFLPNRTYRIFSRLIFIVLHKRRNLWIILKKMAKCVIRYHMLQNWRKYTILAVGNSNLLGSSVLNVIICKTALHTILIRFVPPMHHVVFESPFFNESYSGCLYISTSNIVEMIDLYTYTTQRIFLFSAGIWKQARKMVQTYDPSHAYIHLYFLRSYHP